MDIRIVSGMLLALACSAAAENINLRGKVTDADGKPLPNAVLELTHAKLKDTTGADGLYALASGVIAVRPPPTATSSP